MRKSKELKIGEKTITVYELTVRKIKKLFSDMIGMTSDGPTDSLFTNDALLRANWDECIHGLKIEDTEDMAPSELKEVYDAFAEVNAVFLELATKLEGESPFLQGLRIQIVKDLMLRFAVSLPKDTTSETSGTTDTVSS